MKNLSELVAQLEYHIPDFETSAPAVSKGSVGWHIEHSLLTITRILEAVKSSDPAAYHFTFKPAKLVVLGLRLLPRGRVKSPGVVTPLPGLHKAHLADSVSVAGKSLRLIDSISQQQHFRHPVLGILNKRSTLIFLQVHTRHHLKIITEILAAAKIN